MKKSKQTTKPEISLGIIARRKKLGWSPLKLAEKAKVPYPTLRDIEAGYSGGRPSTRQKIAAALGCTEADLYRSPDQVTKAETTEKADLLTILYSRLPSLDESELGFLVSITAPDRLPLLRSLSLGSFQSGQTNFVRSKGNK